MKQHKRDIPIGMSLLWYYYRFNLLISEKGVRTKRFLEPFAGSIRYNAESSFNSWNFLSSKNVAKELALTDRGIPTTMLLEA